MTRPLLFLDVDGVLSPYEGAIPIDTWPDFEDCPETAFKLQLSRAMAARLSALPVDIVWLTTWEEADWCNSVIGAAFGWEPLPILRRPRNRACWWKLAALLPYLVAHPDTPFIWCDDDIDAHRAEVRTEFERWNVAVPYLLASPPALVGLTPQHVDVFAAWLRDPR